VADIHRWAKANGVPVIRFAKGENKEAIARPLIEAAAREGGDGKVVLNDLPQRGQIGQPFADPEVAGVVDGGFGAQCAAFRRVAPDDCSSGAP
jgi:hypothetical protein